MYPVTVLLHVLGQLLVSLSDLAVLLFSTVSMQMCILLYYNIGANKMMMTMMMICCKVADRHAVFRRRGHACYTTMNPLAAVSGGLSIRKNRQLPKARHGAGARPVHCEFFFNI